MDVLSTPDERFARSPGLPVRAALRRAPTACASTTSTRDRAAAPVLLLHGEPSWSYLYRKMIPLLSRRRASRASRPTWSASAAPTSPRRATTTPTSATSTGCARVLDGLDLRDITLVCQDWGGLIGLRLVAEHPERFARVVAANTFLPTGDARPGAGLLRLAEVLAGDARVSASARIVSGGCATALVARGDRGLRRAVPRRALQGRRAPVPAARADDARRSRRRRPTAPPGRCSSAGSKPFLTAFSDADPITAAATACFQARDSRRARPAAHDHRRRRPLPAGGSRARSWPASWSTSSRPSST